MNMLYDYRKFPHNLVTHRAIKGVPQENCPNSTERSLFLRSQCFLALQEALNDSNAL